MSAACKPFKTTRGTLFDISGIDFAGAFYFELQNCTEDHQFLFMPTLISLVLILTNEQLESSRRLIIYKIKLKSSPFSEVT